ncbi:MAG TPA: nucleotidyltransferase domain-containing protein [Limnochordia bacterium]
MAVERADEGLDIAHFRAAWNARQARAEAAAEALRREARIEAERLARLLGETFSVRRVILFGSTLRLGRFHPHSDIDLAVEGLAPELLYRAQGQLLSWSRYSVDLVPIEDAPPLLARRIAEGEVLYERDA